MPRYLNSYTAPDAEGRQDRRTTGDEVWEAISADGLWSYVRVDGEAGTPWAVTYLPTGQTATFPSLPKARRWTAHQDGQFALDNLRAAALLVIDRQGGQGTILCFNPGTSEHVKAAARAREAEACAERVGAARRALAVLDGLLLPDDPDTRCTGEACGGYLTALVAGDAAAWAHADACGECVDEPIEKRRECWQAHRHAPCGDADPVLCEHSGCTVPTLPDLPGGCSRGRDACCGCCDHDE